MTDFARRRFLQSSALMGGLALAGCSGGNNQPAPANSPANLPACNPPARVQRLGTVVGGGADGSGKFFVGINDLDAKPPSTRHPEDIGFLGHGFTPRIDKPHIVLITEKHGQGCCEFDLDQGKVLRRIKTGAGREFYGHSAFSPDGKLWYCTEANTGDGSYDGVLAIRDAQSFELRPENFPTHGISPHDCILVDDGDTMVITNGGGPVDVAAEPAGVAYVDVKSGKARKVLKFKNEKINAGHIAITAKGELVCVSAPRDGIKDTSPDYRGAISFYDPKTDKFTTAEDPIRAKMVSETLSVAIREETMVVAATNPKGNLVTFWDFKTGLLVKSLEQFKAPRGITLTLDGKYFALTHDVATHITLINAETLEPAEQVVETSYISGSHNYVLDL